MGWRGGDVLLFLVLADVGDEEGETRVDPALLEVVLKLGLDVLVKVVELKASTLRISTIREERRRDWTHLGSDVESLALPVLLGSQSEGQLGVIVERDTVDRKESIYTLSISSHLIGA
jgi:hypothetical protein